jgi:ribonuclease HI
MNISGNGKKEISNSADQGKELEVDRTHLRKDSQAIERQVLNWNPQGRREGGRSKRTWRKTVEEGVEKAGKAWKEVGALIQNRVRWISFLEALCS